MSLLCLTSGSVFLLHKNEIHIIGFYSLFLPHLCLLLLLWPSFHSSPASEPLHLLFHFSSQIFQG